MICPQCGTENADTAPQCIRCARVFTVPGQTLTASTPGMPFAGMPFAGMPFAGIPPRLPNHLVFAILTTLFCCLPAGIVGIVYAAQVNGKLDAGDLAGAQRASKNAQIWCWVSLGLGLFIVLIWIAIAVPSILKARAVANEKSATMAIQTLAEAEQSYSESNEQTGFTCSLSDLQHAGLISGDIAKGEKSGYTYHLHGCFSDSPGGPNTVFKITATPIKPGDTGHKTICTDQTGVVRSSKANQNCFAGASLEP